MRKYKLKRAFCGILAMSLCFSMTGCGKDKNDFSDYGNGDTIVASDSGSETASSTNGLKVEKGNHESLRKFYGTKSKKWEDAFQINTTNFNVDVDFYIPDIDGLNVYNMRVMDDGKSIEEEIVKNIFGDSAKKIEELKYVNETDYIPLMYKYRKIKNYSDFINNLNENQTTGDIFDRSVIDSSFTETYKWLDDTDLYLHMYEGDYEGHRFGLLLGYDYNINKRYIFLEPISISEYFPNNDFKSLVVTGSYDKLSQPLDIDNACSLSMDEIKSNAASFIENKLKLSGVGEITEDAFLYQWQNSDNLASYDSTTMSVGTLTGYHYNPGSSVLMFSDKDYISTLKNKTDGDKLDYEILSSQNDIYADYMKSHSNSDTNIYQFLSTSSVEIKSMLDTPNLTTDGYAVYLQNDYSLIEDWINIDALTPGNTGSIKFTSKGLYSVDLEISSEVLDKVENVKLLELDKIIESFKAQLPEKYLPEKFHNAEKITIGNAHLKYLPLAGDTNDGNKYSNIPVWVIELWEGDQPEGGYGEAYVNAMDGTLMDISYHEFYY